MSESSPTSGSQVLGTVAEQQLTRAITIDPSGNSSTTAIGHPGLKKIAPYWYAYTTMAKERWLGREILEMVSTEFRDRSMEYYRFALESGVTTINGKVAKPDTIIRNGDRIENVVHRHEPPVTSTPVQVLMHDVEREFIIVNKPGSIPVHASGRYFRNTLIEILVNDFGYTKVYPVNRLDRLTSGLMVLPLSSDRARQVAAEFMAGTVQKEYVARCSGRFPEEEIVCEEPLLTVDRQMGLNIVHPEGKPAKTIFNLVRYDAHTDSSVVRCRPITGRSHQLRVHLQYLGHPIANDPVYSETKIWGDNLGRGGIDIVPSTERAAPVPPAHLAYIVEQGKSPENLSKDGVTMSQANEAEDGLGSSSTKLFPRETGHDIGMGSPVPLSLEAVRVITKLRNMKDEDEDWSRWRDVVFRAKGTLAPVGITHRPCPPPHRRERGGPSDGKKKDRKWRPQKGPKLGDEQSTSNADVLDVAGVVSEDAAVQTGTIATHADAEALPTQTPIDSSLNPKAEDVLSPADSSKDALMTQSPAANPAPDPSIDDLPITDPTVDGTTTDPSQLTTSEALAKLSSLSVTPENGELSSSSSSQALYCPECYLPLHPDPKPEKLYIFLHARKYTMSLGCFETPMPEWAEEGFVWDRT